MKNKILQEQKLMLSLMGYDRGLTSFENGQQLKEGLFVGYHHFKDFINESTSTDSSGAYETPRAWQAGGELTQPPREEIMSVELGVTLPSEVDITGGNIGGFGDMGPSPCSACGNSHDGPCDYSEMPDEIDDEVWDIDIEMDGPNTLNGLDSQEEISDVLPDSLLNLFGDVNVGGDLEIEIEEEPKKLRGSRKFRK